MERCGREIAAVEAEILAGNSNLPGLCLALSDWFSGTRNIHRAIPMKQSLARRLAQLEIHAAAQRAKTPAPGFGAVEKLREVLQGCGVEQLPAESMAEATARALGMSCPELRRWLEVRAYGN